MKTKTQENQSENSSYPYEGIIDNWYVSIRKTYGKCDEMSPKDFHNTVMDFFCKKIAQLNKEIEDLQSFSD